MFIIYATLPFLWTYAYDSPSVHACTRIDTLPTSIKQVQARIYLALYLYHIHIHISLNIGYIRCGGRETSGNTSLSIGIILG